MDQNSTDMPDTHRFKVELYGIASRNAMVITDRYTGCEYLAVYEGISYMQHTCYVDQIEIENKAKEENSHGNASNKGKN